MTWTEKRIEFQDINNNIYRFSHSNLNDTTYFENNTQKMGTKIHMNVTLKMYQCWEEPLIYFFFVFDSVLSLSQS